MARAKRRITNTKRINNRHASWDRCQARKKVVREAQKTAERRNDKLRAEGLPTPHEARKEAHRAARALLVEQGLVSEQRRNERGFIVEVVDGHERLRDPGGWHKRRKERFAAISNGFIKA